jgi:hypothetical protein
LFKTKEDSSTVIHIEVSEEIAASVQDVFNYTMEVGNLAAWQSALVDAYTDGPPGVGNVTTQVRTIAGIRVESQIECTDFIAPYQATFQVIKGPVPFTVTQHYEEIDGGTRITVIIKGEVKGPLKVLGEGEVTNQTESELVADLAMLKGILEG